MQPSHCWPERQAQVPPAGPAEDRLGPGSGLSASHLFRDLAFKLLRLTVPSQSPPPRLRIDKKTATAKPESDSESEMMATDTTMLRDGFSSGRAAV